MSTASEGTTGTAVETAVQGAPAAASPVTGAFSSVTNFLGLTSSKETEETLEAERMKCNKDIDARLQKLREAAAPAAATMGGGRNKRSTKRSTRRSKRSKKTKRRRGKRTRR